MQDARGNEKNLGEFRKSQNLIWPIIPFQIPLKYCAKTLKKSALKDEMMKKL